MIFQARPYLRARFFLGVLRSLYGVRLMTLAPLYSARFMELALWHSLYGTRPGGRGH